jgi:electron transfer flavoprotein beta subunit
MKILVPIKRAIDYNIKPRVNRNGDGVVTEGVKNRIALEEAIQLRERGEAEEVIAVSIGVASTEQQLRNALAMGADRAILLTTEQAVQPPLAARALLAIRAELDADLVLMGKQAIDDDANQTGQMLAGLWDRPQATFTSRLEVESGWLHATREVDAGLETIAVELPAVVTADLRLNEPRLIKMPDIMKAKRKPLDERPLEALRHRQRDRAGIGWNR